MECKANNCPVTATLDVIGGKWKPIILWLLNDQTRRFSEIKRNLPGITQKMLTQQLRELEQDGIVHREIYAQVPPRVEYSLTDKGRTLGPILQQMAKWGRSHLDEIHQTQGQLA
ncbi:MAG TPA: helix-turn-helix domain-containing protein [Candidatus Obscuribacterales bacterium]